MSKIGEYEFNADAEENKRYYLNNQLCDCLACKNYYAGICKAHPELVSFLKGFGVDATRPDELSWLEQSLSEQTILYEAMYSIKGVFIKGEISQLIGEKISVDGLDVYFRDCDFPNDRSTKCFGIRVIVTLSWELEESYEDWFISENKKGFLNSIFGKIYKRRKHG